MLSKNDLKLIGAFIDSGSAKNELNFAKFGGGAIVATDTKKAIRFNYDMAQSVGLMHKKLLKGFEGTMKKNDEATIEDGFLISKFVKIRIDTGFNEVVDGEDVTKQKANGASALRFPNIDDVVNKMILNHFTLESIDDLHFELSQRDCFIDDVHLNPIISFSNCSEYDIYFEPQREVIEDDGKRIERGIVKIIGKTVVDGAINNKFVAVVMGRTFKSKAKK